MKYYLSGPMEGIPEGNYPAFSEAIQRLSKDGIEVVCLASKEAPEGQMKARLEALMDCDAVIVLPWWAASNDSKAEVLVAVSTKKEIYAFKKNEANILQHLPNVNIITRAEVLTNV